MSHRAELIVQAAIRSPAEGVLLGDGSAARGFCCCGDGRNLAHNPAPRVTQANSSSTRSRSHKVENSLAAFAGISLFVEAAVRYTNDWSQTSAKPKGALIRTNSAAELRATTPPCSSAGLAKRCCRAAASSGASNTSATTTKIGASIALVESVAPTARPRKTALIYEGRSR